MLRITQGFALLAVIASTTITPTHSLPITSLLVARTPGLGTAIFSAATSTIESAVKTKVDDAIVDKIEHPKVAPSSLPKGTPSPTATPKPVMTSQEQVSETPKQRKEREKKAKAAKDKEEARVLKQKKKDREREEQRLYYEKMTKLNAERRERYMKTDMYKEELRKKEEEERARRKDLGLEKREEEGGEGLKRVLDSGESEERSGLEREGGGVWRRAFAEWFGVLGFGGGEIA